MNKPREEEEKEKIAQKIKMWLIDEQEAGRMKFPLGVIRRYNQKFCNGLFKENIKKKGERNENR